MRVVVSPATGSRRLGLVSHLYEVTNTLVSPWPDAAERYTRLFGLDPARFSPITSERFGYTGTLTLFDPPGPPGPHRGRAVPSGWSTSSHDVRWRTAS